MFLIDEKKGLVVRQRATTDRRAVNIIITDAGKDYLKGSSKLLQDRLANRLSNLCIVQNFYLKCLCWVFI